MLQYDIHPLNVRVCEDMEFFNHPHPEIDCLHCGFPCDRQAPIGVPMMHQDAKLGSANPRDSNQMQHETIHIHRFYCSLECGKACIEDVPMFARMLSKIYGIHDPLSVRTALPQWTLSTFGGPLNRNLYEQYKREGKIKGYYMGEGAMSEPLSLMEEYRTVCLLLKSHNPYLEMIVPTEHVRGGLPWYHQALPAKTRLVCWNDMHPLSNIQPCSMVHEYDEVHNMTYSCSGLFCGLSCVLSYVMRHEGQLKMQKIKWNQEFYAQQLESSLPITSDRACSRRLLKKFGGLLTIDQFRHKTRPFQFIREPPIRDFGNLFATPYQEEGDLIYNVVYSLHSFHVLSLFHIDNAAKKLTMQGDEYGQNTRHFPKLFHRVGANHTHQLHVTLMVMEREDRMKTKHQVLQSITEQAE